MKFQTQNPYSEQIEKSFDLMMDEALDQNIAKAHKAFASWKLLSYQDRATYFYKLIDLIKERREMLAGLISKEMGKPISEALPEVDKCCRAIELYADKSAEFLKQERLRLAKSNAIIRFDALGIIYGIMPWNYPFWQVFRYATPALMAGNTTLLKHAENVPQCALAVAQLFQDAGFPEGVFQNIFIAHEQSEKLIQNPKVRGVTLTGSEKAGSIVAAQAGKAIKKTVLELGGSDPFIVFEDADIDKAVEHGIMSRFQNAGQSCIAAKRFLIHEAIFEDFLAKFKAKAESLKAGNPEDSETTLGPMARADLRDTLHRQVEKSVACGAKLVCGGAFLPGKGYFYAPTILTDVPADSPAYREELFGPVAAFFSFKNKAEAIDLANDTPYGLGSSVWTTSSDLAMEMAAALDTGTVAVNHMLRSDPQVPFGGVKASGYGRELSSHGILEFVNIKTVNIFE